MAKKKSERQHKLSAIEGALDMAYELTQAARLGGFAEIDNQLKAGLKAVQWLRDYPDSLMEPLAALEHDQFHSWCQIYLSQFDQATQDKLMPGLQSYVFVPDCFKINARAWAQAVIDTFKTGSLNLSRRGTRSRRSSLSDGDILRMRHRRADGESLKQLSKAFHISESMVSRISSGKRRVEAGGPLTGGRMR